MKAIIEVYTSGCYLPGSNSRTDSRALHSGPGKWCYGVHPRWGDARVICSVEDTTGHRMSYIGLIHALMDLTPICDRLIAYNDDQAVMRQLHGLYRVKDEHLRRLYVWVKELLRSEDELRWIPRRQNIASKILEEAKNGYIRTFLQGKNSKGE